MKRNYVLITPARNEEKYIDKTIRAVTSQTVLPLKWIIISDGSMDRTEEIVRQYAEEHRWIELLRREPDGGRDFGSKVYAIRAGVDCLGDADYDFIGLMDADVSFAPDFFLRIINRLNKNPKLGIGGGALCELISNRWVRQSYSYEWSVAGPMQLFRRECYQDIGGYVPLRRGGVDMIAEVMARMKGWQVQTFEDIEIYHFRITGTAKGSELAWCFRRGMMEYINGYHLIFQIARFFSWISTPPYLLASLFRTGGYFWAVLRRERLAVPNEVASYLRKEQMERLKKTFLKRPA